MKSINFQRNKSLIRVVNEEKIKKRRNWDRIIYLVLLVLFLIFLFYFMIYKAFYIRANGEVIIDSMKIRLTDDSRLVKYWVSEGDSIEVGDTLFSYALDEDLGDGDAGGGGGGNSITLGATGGGDKDLWWLKELYNLRKKVALNNIEITENRILADTYQKEIKRLSNEVVLDVLPKTRLDYVQNEILRLNTQNLKLAAENNQLNFLMGTLGPFKGNAKDTEYNIKMNSVGKSYASGNGRSNARYGHDKINLAYAELCALTGENLGPEKFFLAPMHGIVTREYVHQFETALKSEDIMTIHQDHPAFVKAFFEQEDMQYFNEGDELKVIFPDGTTSVGVIRRFYIATYVLPDEFQKRYEPVTRSIAADIYPANLEEETKWKNFYKMGVQIVKFKY